MADERINGEVEEDGTEGATLEDTATDGDGGGGTVAVETDCCFGVAIYIASETEDFGGEVGAL